MTVMVDEPNWMRAKRVADSVRMENAKIRVYLASLDRPDALRQLADLLEDPPPSLGGAKVGRVLSFPPGSGKASVQQGLRQAQVDGSVRVEALTSDQRRALGDWLWHRADLTEYHRARNLARSAPRG